VTRTEQIPTGSFGTVFDDRRSQTADTHACVDLAYGRCLNEDTQIIARVAYGPFACYADCLYANFGAASPTIVNVLGKKRNGPVLVIGDLPNLAEKGAIINFLIEDNKMGFAMNPGAAKQADLQIGSKLTRLEEKARL
jgi:hypothetical protein